MIKDIFQFAIVAYSEPTKDNPLFRDCVDYVSMTNDTDFAFIANYPDRLIISFRGTDNLNGWISDFKGFPTAESTIEQGFYDGWVEFKAAITNYVEQYSYLPIYCTGHSRGAALATLCARHIAKNMFIPCSNINFGSPMVFNWVGRDVYNYLPINTTRCVNGWDFAERIPPELFGLDYRHVGTRVHFPQPLWHKYFRKLRDHYQTSYQKAIDTYTKRGV